MGAESPVSLLQEIMAKDLASVEELKGIEPSYTAPQGLLDLHARIQSCVDRYKEMEQLLYSAKCIADRGGADTNWTGFSNSIQKLGINGITARTYRAFRES